MFLFLALKYFKVFCESVEKQSEKPAVFKSNFPLREDGNTEKDNIIIIV